ncbi:MAG: adenine phosphoribosyltransferase [Clostridia bacterium]|nr:adenine phosphoribosyltransferase [Clostridia bacterium]
MYTEQDFKATIREIPDFPKEGILFYDITTLLKNPSAYNALINEMANSLIGLDVDVVVGPEARGFVVGSPVAYALNAGFVLARKPGKLPSEVERLSYGLEYGSDTLEIHRDAIKPGMRVAIADDLLATGGTALATAKLFESMGAEVVGLRFAIELTDLNGVEKLKDYDVRSVIKY